MTAAPTSNRISRRLVLAYLVLVTLAAVAAVSWITASGRDQAPLSEAAEPYRADLEAAAAQCPTVVTAPRLDRLIEYTTGWDTTFEHEHPVHGTTSITGLSGAQWEAAGGGEVTDVATGIRNSATLWCDYASQLRGEDIPTSATPPAGNGDADDEPRAAALGLAAIHAGPDYVRTHGLGPGTNPSVTDLVEAVI